MRLQYLKKAVKTMLKFLKRHTLAAALILTLITAFAVLAISAEMDAREIRDSVLRFHIVANSNSEADQLNKMKVREGIAALTGELFSGAGSKAQAMALASDNLDALSARAGEILSQNGCSLPVTVEVRKRFFPTKEYAGVTLPAGVYDAIDLRIGAAEGENFWCVMFPPICIGAAADTDDAEQNRSQMAMVLEGDSLDMATGSSSPKIQLKFKVVEFFQQLFHNVHI